MLFPALCLALVGAASADEEGGDEGDFLEEDRADTLFGGDIESGGYGAPHLKLTLINGELAVLSGGRGGWIINDAFVIGGLGYGIVNNPEIAVGQGTGALHMRYGGLFLEGVFLSKKVVHFSIEGFGGSGTVGFDAVGSGGAGGGGYEDNIYVLEATARLELNMTDWFRLAVGPGYRLVTGVDAEGAGALDLSGPAVEVMAKFGFF